MDCGAVLSWPLDNDGGVLSFSPITGHQGRRSRSSFSPFSSFCSNRDAARSSRAKPVGFPPRGRSRNRVPCDSFCNGRRQVAVLSDFFSLSLFPFSFFFFGDSSQSDIFRLDARALRRFRLAKFRSDHGFLPRGKYLPRSPLLFPRRVWKIAS